MKVNESKTAVPNKDHLIYFEPLGDETKDGNAKTLKNRSEPPSFAQAFI